MIAIFPETLACAAKGDMEELAVLVRRYYGEDQKYAPNPDIKGIVERVGLKVESIPLEGLGALVAKDEYGTFTTALIVSPRIDKTTARFLLAHLLGHYFIDIQPMIARGEMERIGLRESVCPMRRYAQGDPLEEKLNLELAKEMRADLFAGALLMPLGMLKRATQTLKDREKVARFFDVSLGCLQRRLSDIGLHHDQPGNFLDAEKELLRQGSEASAEDEHPPLEMQMEPLTPRAFAASTYGQTARTTAQITSESQRDERPVGSRAQVKVARGRTGMQRIRDIARQLDRGPSDKSET